MTPRIFISSTIYDFADLRSAIKYYLENLGYEVQLSEFNDFKIDPLKDSYNNCLDNIKNCDYFILLIGSRKGGMFDLTTSITQKEYQTAYELAKDGKIRIINFVRKVVWDIREDRKDLKKYLSQDSFKKYNISEEDLLDIINHDGKLVKDSDFIFNFINEVARNKEMSEALSKGKDYPKSNWIHQFSTFKDIADMLSVEYNLKYDLQTKTILKYLKDEFTNNFILLTYKNESSTMPIFWYGRFLETLDWENEDMKIKEHIKINEENLIGFWFFLLYSVTFNVKTIYLEKIIDSGFYLKIDNINDTKNYLQISENLIQLRKEVEKLKSLEKILNTEEIIKQSKEVTKALNNRTEMNIFFAGLLPYRMLYESLYNVYHLIGGLYNAIFENNFSILTNLKLLSYEPFKNEKKFNRFSFNEGKEKLKIFSLYF